MTDLTDKPKPKPKRKGTWEEIQTFSDPDSNISVLISERIRGKPAYSIQLVHVDNIGPNKHIELPAAGKHNVEDIVFSLCKAASEFINARKHKEKMKKANA